MPDVKLYLFGSPHFEIGGRPVKLELRKSLSLLAYLAVQEESLQRDFIINLLWPEEEPSRGRSLLRHVLSPLRIALPEGVLTSDRDTIGLSPENPLWVDVLEFRRLVTGCGGHGHAASEVCPACHPALSEAVGLYAEDFMTGFTLPDSPDFDEWQYFQAESLRQMLDNALKKLVQCLIRMDTLDQAIQPARRRLVIDRLNEHAHRDLMLLYAWTHQRNLALRQYRECKEALSDQLGIEPQTATLDLMRAIESGHIPDRPIDPAWMPGVTPVLTGAIQEDRDLSISQHPAPLKYSLPVQLTSFIGRSSEINEITALVRDHRLVTLTGSGGVGKTRLALRAAEGLMDAFPEGVCLVELASLSEPGLLAQTVIAALELADQPGKTPARLLMDFLKPRQILLILDNCEHLIDDCSKLVDALLQNAPGLVILATSREILGVAGEIHFRVPPMAMPDPHRLPALDELARFDALRLFVERARMVSLGFLLTADNAKDVVQITQRLDGIPLAIELAAARVRLLSVGQIAQRLDDFFRLLTGGNRGVLPRHQTLTALIDWSYNLLSEDERSLLRGLSVFSGGWSLEAAEEVCGASQDILDLLGQLADKSLILATPAAGGEMRYHILETVRQYAHTRLVDAGEAVVVHQSHLDYFLRLVERLEPKLRGREQIYTLDYLNGELDNLRLALERSHQVDVEVELRLVSALTWFWHIRYHWTEGIAWLEQGLKAEALTRGGLPPTGSAAHIRAKALAALGFHIMARDTYNVRKALPLLEEAVGLYQIDNLAHPGDLAWALVWLGCCKQADGDPGQAKALAEEALSLFREAGVPHGMAESLGLLGWCEIDPIPMKQLFLEALAIEEAQGDIDGTAHALDMVATNCFIMGDYENAFAGDHASQGHFRLAGNDYMVALSGHAVAMKAHFNGNLEIANQYLDQALADSRAIANENLMISCLGWRIMIAFTQGRYDQAAQFIEEAARVAQKSGDPAIFTDAPYHWARLARHRGELAAARQLAEEASTGKGEFWGPRIKLLVELTYLALQDGDLARGSELCHEGLQVVIHRKDNWNMLWVLDGLTVLAVRERKLEQAARFFGTRMWRGFANLLSPIERAEREADLAQVRAGLGEERFAALQAEGSAMTFMQILALAQEEG